VITFTVPCTAAPAAAWSLYARPDRWSEWAPHVRGAWGLGDPVVAEGASGAIRLAGVVPIPARILAVDAPREWTWQVGPVVMRHWVAPDAVGLDLSARGPLERALGLAYGPVVRVLLGRLARRAERR
jgi:hypothetical protein